MKRRLFIASLVATPAVVKAAVTAEPQSARQVWFVDWRDIDLVTDRNTTEMTRRWNNWLAKHYGVST